MAAARSAAPARPASRRGLHGRLLEVCGEDRLRLLHRLDLEQPLAQLGRARHALRVPAKMLAELKRRAAGSALEPELQPPLLQGHPEPLRPGPVPPPRSSRPEIARLREDPPGAERAARDSD